MYAEPLGFVVVTRMEDVQEVFLNPEVYSSANVQDPVFPICDEAAAVLAADDFNPVAVMSNRQEPDHGRIRQFTKKRFSNRRSKTLEPYIRRRTNGTGLAALHPELPSNKWHRTLQRHFPTRS